MSAWMRIAPTSSALLLAASMMLGSTARLSASPIETPVNYSTYGSVDSFGVNGLPIVFKGVQYGSLTTGSTFNLGQFALPDALPMVNLSTTVTNVPFQIALRVQSVGGAAPSSNTNDTPVLLQGTLSAVVDGGRITSLTALFSNTSGGSSDAPFPSTIPNFRIADYSGYLNVTASGNNGAPIQGVLNVTPVPEPATMLIFAAGAGLVALRARRRKS